METHPEAVSRTGPPATEPQLLELQRKFGRCLLRLQQYENLAKRVLANHNVESSGTGIHPNSETVAEATSMKTLGPLAKEIANRVVVSDAAQDNQDKAIAGDPTQIRIRTTFRRVMPAEDHQEFKTQLEFFVDMRNELVHHFLQRFDIFDSGGCNAAMSHLDVCSKSIDVHLQDLEDLARDIQRTSLQFAQLMGQASIMEFLTHEITSDRKNLFGPKHKLIRWLKRAECMAEEDGWTSLASTENYINTHAPALSLAVYKVGKWSEVLARSNVFETRVELPFGITEPTRWYRSPPTE